MRNLVACSYPGCCTLVPKGRCPRHQAQDRRPGYAKDKRFYDSVQWKRVRDAKMRRDPLCQYCLYTGRVTEGREVDHYTPLERGGHATHSDNLVTACHSCHSRKTRSDEHGQPPPPYAPSAVQRYTFA